MLRHERRHDLLFVTRDSELGKRLRRAHGLESVQSMLWIEGGRVFAESGAVMKAARYLGGFWSRLALLGSLCPSLILNGVYKFIAKNRRRLSSNAAVCLALSPAQRNRFLS
jgi:predicted DCC family thiol-disulfide oxidoreductase YuxK